MNFVPDVEVHLDEEGPVLVGLDLDGEGGVGVRDGAAAVLVAEVDLAEAADADRAAEALALLAGRDHLARRDGVGQLVAVGSLPRLLGRHAA